MTNELTIEHLQEVLSYDPHTGVFRWGRGLSGRRQFGRIAGYAADGYRKISVYDRGYFAHRLAWFYVHGEWPAGEVDHENGNRSDNRLCNLRDCSKSQNQANSPVPRSNTSGFKGVSWHKRIGRWQAYVSMNKQRRYLGYFDTREAAAVAYDNAATNLFGEFARTNAMLVA